MQKLINKGFAELIPLKTPNCLHKKTPGRQPPGVYKLTYLEILFSKTYS